MGLFITMVAFVGIVAFLLVWLFADWYEQKHGNPFDVFLDEQAILGEASNPNTFKCASGCEGNWSVDWFPNPKSKGARFCPNCTGAD